MFLIGIWNKQQSIVCFHPHKNHTNFLLNSKLRSWNSAHPNWSHILIKSQNYKKIWQFARVPVGRVRACLHSIHIQSISSNFSDLWWVCPRNVTINVSQFSPYIPSLTLYVWKFSCSNEILKHTTFPFAHHTYSYFLLLCII